MFGYVRAFPPQLRVWEHEIYKGIYCGLCKHGGKRTTRLTRFFLSYDFVALAIVRMALTNENPRLEKQFCPYMPKKKKMIANSPSLEYAADAFVILAYYKLLDDKEDTKGIKRIFTNLSPAFLKKKAVIAENRREGLGKLIKDEISRLSVEEKNSCSSLDKVADCFAVLLGKVLSYDLEGNNERIAYEIGYHLGRYVYIIDAFDDFEKDLKENNYNPLIVRYSTYENFKKNEKEIVDTLKSSLDRVYVAAELIENNKLLGLIENITTYGAIYTISMVKSKTLKKEMKIEKRQ